MAYTQNELGEFLKHTFKLSRNPYNRIVHFSFGFLMIYPLCDYLVYNYQLSKKHLILLSNMIIFSLATIFELIEWGVAAFTDSATGETYVATQGDPWDAQKDIILAVLGSVLFLVKQIIFRKKLSPRYRPYKPFYCISTHLSCRAF